MESFQQKDREFVLNTYKRFPVEIVSGKGSRITDVKGKEYIDLGSGIGVTAFGIGDAEWKKAVTDQLDRIQHTSNLYYTKPCADLAEILCERTGMKKVFFCNSGAEANECIIKAARRYGEKMHGKDCNLIVTLENSFHGRTITTLAATGQDHYHEAFQPLTPGFLHVKAGDTKRIAEYLESGKVAGILMECVQGEGGVVPLSPAFVLEAAEMCRRKDVLLMFDEVQTGNGRTGTLYAYQQFGVEADLVSTAKGLGGGLPLGAALFGRKTENILSFGEHGSTFGGNPVCCAGAISVLKRMDENFLSDVKRKSALAFSLLEGAKGVKSVSGMGLMIGILPLKKKAQDVVNQAIEKGVLCLTAKDKIRLLPALNIPDEDLKEGIGILKDILAE